MFPGLTALFSEMVAFVRVTLWFQVCQLSSSLFLFACLPCRTEKQSGCQKLFFFLTQSFVLMRQVLYCLSHSISPQDRSWSYRY
jgi:hypothetical protein